MRKGSRLFLQIATRVVVCIALLVIGVGITGALVASRPLPERRDEAALVRSVTVFPLQRVDVPRQWTGYGTARALRSVDVPARISAVVVNRPAHMERGAIVRAGEVLVMLDPTDFEWQAETSRAAMAVIDAEQRRLHVESAGLTERLEIARAQLAIAAADLARVQEAGANDAAMAREIDAARQARLAADRERALLDEALAVIPARRDSLAAQRAAELARLRIAEEQISRTVITSPIDGILESLDVESGENVQPGTRIARLVDPREIEVPLRLPSSARRFVRPGDRVQVSPTGDAGTVWEGSVVRIAPEDDPRTRTMTVFAQITADADAARRIAPGQFVRGEVTSLLLERRFIVPRRAVLRDRIMVVGEDDRLDGRRVDVAWSVVLEHPVSGLPDIAWLVLEGDDLPEGARVVAEASRRLYDGMQVRPAAAVRHPGRDASEVPR